MANNIPNKPPSAQPKTPPPPSAKPAGGGGEPSEKDLEKVFMDTMVSAARGQKMMQDIMDGMQKKAADKLKEDQKETLEAMDD
jgi:hypothetical protein